MVANSTDDEDISGFVNSMKSELLEDVNQKSFKYELDFKTEEPLEFSNFCQDNCDVNRPYKIFQVTNDQTRKISIRLFN